MASAEGGYECDFISEVPEDLICSVCHFVVREPIQLENCGHGMCKLCFNHLKDHADSNGIDFTCPMDREMIDTNKVFNDKSASRRVLNLIVHCPYKSEGCGWAGELRDLQAHEESCPRNVDSIGMHDLKLKLDQLQTSVSKNEQEINNHKKTIANLTNTITELQTTVDKLQTLVSDITCQAKISADMNSNEEFETFKWIISINKLKQCEQYSKQFYITQAPFLLQMSAAITGCRLETWLFRCRGKNDKAGKILSKFCDYRCVMYLVNEAGEVYVNTINFPKNDTYLNVGAVYEKSKGRGWEDFFKTSPSNWHEWIIKNHLHFFCKLELVSI